MAVTVSLLSCNSITFPVLFSIMITSLWEESWSVSFSSMCLLGMGNFFSGVMGWLQLVIVTLSGLFTDLYSRTDEGEDDLGILVISP